MIPPNFFNLLGYRIGLNHYAYHCIIALSIQIAIGLVSGGNWLAGAVGGAIFYWSRELAQYDFAGAVGGAIFVTGNNTKFHFEWMDAIWPTIAVTILYIIATLI
jgi:nitrogen fixation-related uncharacterized protein